jgi:hypothetical protein
MPAGLRNVGLVGHMAVPKNYLLVSIRLRAIGHTSPMSHFALNRIKDRRPSQDTGAYRLVADLQFG